jgi:predicted transcriptional regulator
MLPVLQDGMVVGMIDEDTLLSVSLNSHRELKVVDLMRTDRSTNLPGHSPLIRCLADENARLASTACSWDGWKVARNGD